jgi:bacteriocin biosynthesis cyclodehydratase domain-containing protein
VDDRSLPVRACGKVAAMRPILRPGTHVLRRPAAEVQVGLDPGGALVLPDSPPVRQSLRLLATSADRDAYADPSVLDLLQAHDTLVDERDLMPGLVDDEVSPATAAALTREAGPDVARVRAARRRWRTQTRSFGHPAGDGLRNAFVALARAAGLREAAARRSAPPDGGVLLGVGEPDREEVDAWTRAGTPHLTVRLTEGRAVIGPFVVPGTTACLRCLDAHCTDADPAWPLLVRQYVAASARDRTDGAPEPVDPLLASLALAWAASDLASYVDGRRPSTWSGTVTIHARLTRLETRRWLRHPGCGCTWG